MADEAEALPQPYNAKSLQAAKKRALSPSEQQQPRKQKRPGARARLSEADREAIRQRQLERERNVAAHEAAAAEASRLRGINDVVRQHYNNVPERGREFRTTDSKIKGLRVFNNWVKSCIIQKFSPDEDHAPGSRQRGQSSGEELKVLDVGCGKGGDLNKWQKAPQRVSLYVGLDPAEVSISQAKERFRSMANPGGGRGGRGGHYRNQRSNLFHGEFIVKDCFAETIEDLRIIRDVGFDPSPMNRHGFDVVSMMFAMHYAFESEQKARTMLRNVAGALKKGGRFLGTIPNSDVIRERVAGFNAKKAELAQKAEEGKEAKPDSEEEKKEEGEEEEEGEEGEVEEDETQKTAEWGNSIYKVRFPGETPADGMFRPPFGWKYNFFLHEAVEEVPEYVVPWEAFRSLAEDFNLEMLFCKPFMDVWEAEKDDRDLGPLSERMGVRERGGGGLLMSEEEKEAASFYLAFCFYKV